jgi:16S rRNA processing protein RimM
MREDAGMLVVVGRIGRSHGVRGEVSVELRTDEPDARFAVGARLQADGPRPRRLTIKSVRPHSGRLLIAFDEVVNRTQAELLRGATLSAEIEADRRPDDPEEFYDRQLVGLEVHSGQVGAVGQVVGVVHLPLQDLLSIRRADGCEVMVPFVAELVPEVDLAAGTLRVVDRPGLLNPDDERAADLRIPGDG